MAPTRLSARLVTGVLAAVAVLLALRGTALAQQAPQIVAARVAAVPLSPTDPAWQQARPVSVPLIPQTVAQPRLAQMSVSTVAVQTLTDGNQVAFRLEWLDPTRDVRATRPDEFRDAAAILLPVGDVLPNICMGVAGQLTNLWHWKADWQEDLDRGFQDVVDSYPNFYKDSYPFVTGTPPFRAPADFSSPEAQQYLVGRAAGNPLADPARTSPVEELISEGFGTATHRPQQGVAGQGVWTDGRWQVVFTRPLAARDAETSELAGKDLISAAFAVWNGANQEVGARKQLSSFITVALNDRALASPAFLALAPVREEGFLWIPLTLLAILFMLSPMALEVGLRLRGSRRASRRG